MPVKAKKKPRAPLSKGQGRLLKSSLQKLLGAALLEERPVIETEIRPFLKEALNSRFLNTPPR